VTMAETHGVVNPFLAQHPEFAPDPFPNPLTGDSAAGPLQLWPWEGPGDGMFIARLRRIRS
jgi:16S rRNA (cytosine967-C5)-methyltransferase